jgi:hypothetical protein
VEEKYRIPTLDDLKNIIKSLNENKVDYLLIGGFAVNANDLIRTTKDIDFVVPKDRTEGEKIIQALMILPNKNAKDIDLTWFDKDTDDSTIRVFDDIIVDFLFNACGQTYENLKKYEKIVYLDDIPVKTVNIEGLILTKQTFREQDKLDLQALKTKLEQDKKNQ